MMQVACHCMNTPHTLLFLCDEHLHSVGDFSLEAEWPTVGIWIFSHLLDDIELFCQCMIHQLRAKVLRVTVLNTPSPRFHTARFIF